MKKAVLIGGTITFFVLMGLFIFGFPYLLKKFGYVFYIILGVMSIPGFIATLISQGIFHTKGAESLFLLPEAIITIYLFWLLIPWIFLFTIKNWKSPLLRVKLFFILSIASFSGSFVSAFFIKFTGFFGSRFMFIESLFRIFSILSPITFSVSIIALSIIIYWRLQ